MNENVKGYISRNKRFFILMTISLFSTGFTSLIIIAKLFGYPIELLAFIMSGCYIAVLGDLIAIGYLYHISETLDSCPLFCFFTNA